MKDPAFLFYPNDYLGGTMGMTFEEKGAYIELLMLQFNRGRLSDKIIKNLVGDLWNCLSAKFTQDETGLWFNKRLEDEQLKRKNYSESRRNNKIGISKNYIRKSHDSDMNETNIYIIKDFDTGNIKIGASVNPENRLSTIKSRQNKPNIKIIATAQKCTLLDEKLIHEHFKEFNIKGDWFTLNENIVIEHMIKHMNKHMIKHMENENENENKDIIEIKNKEVKEKFEIFRKRFPGTKKGFEIEFENYKKKSKLTDIDLLLPALEKEILHKNKLKESNKFCPEWKNLSTWINQKCWTQEFEIISNQILIKEHLISDDNLTPEEYFAKHGKWRNCDYLTYGIKPEYR